MLYFFCIIRIWEGGYLKLLNTASKQPTHKWTKTVEVPKLEWQSTSNSSIPLDTNAIKNWINVCEN